MIRPRWWVALAGVVGFISWLALYYLLNNLPPNPETFLSRPQLLFFTFLFLGAMGLTIPPAAYLSHRFARLDWPERDRFRLIRQGAWVGLLAVLLAYLQLIRALNLTIAIVLIGVFILIEAFFITRG
jgi:hypothetical protein